MLAGDRAVVARAGGEVLRVGDLGTMLSDVPVFRVDSGSVEMLVTRWGELSLLLQALERGESLTDTATAFAVRWPDIRTNVVEAFYQPLRDSALAPARIDSVFAAGDLVSLEHVLFRAAEDTPDDVRRLQRERAQRARRQLSGGMSWANLMELGRSNDPTFTSEQLGVRTWGETEPAFERAAFALQPGETSEVVESPAGYHIIRRLRFDESDQLFTRIAADSLYWRTRDAHLEGLMASADVSIEDGAFDVMRQAATSPRRAREWERERLATYSGGEIRVPRFIQWLQVLPFAIHNSVPDASDAELREVLLDIVGYEVEYQAATDAGFVASDSAIQAAMSRLEWDVLSVRRTVGVDSVLRAGGSTAGLAAAHFDAWVHDLRNERQKAIPAFLADKLRSEGGCGACTGVARGRSRRQLSGRSGFS
jgi:hypothetical protein